MQKGIAGGKPQLQEAVCPQSRKGSKPFGAVRNGTQSALCDGEYPSDSTFFDVLDYRVAVKDDRLADALAALPSKKRDVLLLSYFLDMSDTEIAEKLKVVGSTIHRRRTSSLKELKLRLEVKEDGQETE